jgi:hypothetical protein
VCVCVCVCRVARYYTAKPDIEVAVYILIGEGRYRRLAPVQFGSAVYNGLHNGLVRTESSDVMCTRVRWCD